MSYIDTHAHIEGREFDADRRAVIERARAAGVETIIAVGGTADSSRQVLELAEDRPEIYAAVGIHPNYSAEATEKDWRRIVAMADRPEVIAIGETGLDNYHDFAPPGRQREYFERHLRLSQDRGLPVVIHCRDAESELMPMLHESAGRGPLCGVLHAFSGDAAMAAECVELGLYVSFAGMVTYRNRKFQSLREAAVAAPDDRLLIETDSPYLAPTPLRGKQQRNEPANIIHTAEYLAELRGVSVEELARQTTQNARRLFKLPGP